jgi:hypothetical protein
MFLSFFLVLKHLGSLNLQVYFLPWFCSETAKTGYYDLVNQQSGFFSLAKFGHQQMLPATLLTITTFLKILLSIRSVALKS